MNQDQSPWRSALNIGLIGALVVVLLALIGMVQTFSKRDIIYQIVTMGNILLLLTAVFFSYLSAKKAGRERRPMVFGTAVLTGALLANSSVAFRTYETPLGSVTSSPVTSLLYSSMPGRVNPTACPWGTPNCEVK